MTLDKLRDTIGCPIIVHNSNGGAVDVDGSWGHAKRSLHLKEMGCKAVDFHFVTDTTLREQYNWVCRMGFGGVGVYPEWNNPGFHVDIRPVEVTQHWTRIRGKYFYLL
jgi:uncharacterized protein YcbK (DUF882 family)